MSFEALTVILTAIALGSYAKGAIGIGLPIMAIPIASAYLGVEHAIVALTPAVVASNIWIKPPFPRWMINLRIFSADSAIRINAVHRS